MTTKRRKPQGFGKTADRQKGIGLEAAGRQISAKNGAMLKSVATKIKLGSESLEDLGEELMDLLIAAGIADPTPETEEGVEVEASRDACFEEKMWQAKTCACLDALCASFCSCQGTQGDLAIVLSDFAEVMLGQIALLPRFVPTEGIYYSPSMAQAHDLGRDYEEDIPVQGFLAAIEKRTRSAMVEYLVDDFSRELHYLMGGVGSRNYRLEFGDRPIHEAGAMMVSKLIDSLGRLIDAPALSPVSVTVFAASEG